MGLSKARPVRAATSTYRWPVQLTRPNVRDGWRRGLARTVLLLAGAALLANAGWLAITANLTVGTAMTALVGLGCLAWGWWLPRQGRRWISAVALLVCATLVGMAAFLAATGSRDDARYDEDAVIVLGAAVHGRELSRTLTGRLDAALDYHARNPSALIVVSGGQGLQEDLPEAAAMQQYLLGHGVPGDDIVVEDRATSTEQNFAFSKVLLDARLPAGYTVAFVTDEFHVYRAGRIATATGLVATHVSSRTPWYFWPPNYLREELAVVLQWLRPGP